jgi:hypothetical protein
MKAKPTASQLAARTRINGQPQLPPPAAAPKKVVNRTKDTYSVNRVSRQKP